MVTTERTEQSQVIGRINTTIKYGSPVIAPLIIGALFKAFVRPGKHLDYPFKPDILKDINDDSARGAAVDALKNKQGARKKGQQFGEQIGDDAFGNGSYAERLNDIGADAFNYLAIGGINLYMSHLRRKEFVDTFEGLVRDELKIPPDQEVTYRDFGRSQNFLIKSTYQQLNRSSRFSWLKDIPYIIGAAAPLVQDVMIFRDYKAKREALEKYFEELKEVPQENLLEGMSRSDYGELQIGKDDNKRDITLQDLLATFEGQKFVEQYKVQLPNALFEKWEAYRDAALRVEDPKEHLPAGVGTPVGLLATAAYNVTEALGSGNDTYLAVRRLIQSIRSQGPNEISTAAIDIYKTYYDNYRERFPEKVAEEERLHGHRPRDEQQDQGFFARLGRGWKRVQKAVGRLFWGDFAEPALVFTPISMDNREDPRMRGVFEYMGELMFRSRDGSEEAQYKKTQFSPEVFMRLISEGWVAVDNSKVTQYVARITAQLGMDGFDRIHRHLEQERQRHNTTKLTPAQMERSLWGLYEQVVHEQLLADTPIARQVVLHVQKLDGRVEDHLLDAQAVAELIGANRLKRFFLELNTPQNVTEPLTELNIGERLYGQLIEKVKDRRNEESGDRYMLLDPKRKDDRARIEYLYEVQQRLELPYRPEPSRHESDLQVNMEHEASQGESRQADQGAEGKVSKKELNRRYQELKAKTDKLEQTIREEKAAGMVPGADAELKTMLAEVLRQQEELIKTVRQQNATIQRLEQNTLTGGLEDEAMARGLGADVPANVPGADKLH